MKKTFLTCLAVVALFAIATSATAITCTIDQRPAATLLIPYFQATFNPDGTILGTGPTALDTLVTIGNASSAPMIAHVNVFNDRTELVLDFNIALTGFDIQSFSMASILRGNLPVTPINTSHISEVKDSHQVTIDGDVCQRNVNAPVFPDPGGYLRVRPTSPATGLDNQLATVSYPAGPFQTAFLFQVLDSLDRTADTNTCGGVGVDNVITNPIHGYLTIDHANYCNLSNPADPAYYTNDAIGMENNLFGDYIFVSGAGLSTLGFPAVAIEADASLSDTSRAPTALSAANGVGRRTFYRRYVTTADPAGCLNAFPAPQSAFDCGGGDQREPLGLKYAARWFDSAPTVTSFFNVWRASSVPSPNGGLADLLGTYTSAGVARCIAAEKDVTLVFFDEDENTVTQGVCPSPCTQPTSNFPLETQRTPITGNASTSLSHPNWPAGWVSMEFFNSNGPVGGALDQAYVTYDFAGAGVFLSAGIPAAQLDPTNCQPLLVSCITAGGPPNCYGPNPVGLNGVTPSAPVIPLIVGTGP
jgi:hypothetical protein